MSVVFWGNDVGDEGALALAVAIASSPNPAKDRYVTMEGPRLTAAGAAAVGEQARANPAFSHTFAATRDRTVLRLSIESVRTV
jgi:hypothetical protein